GCTSRCLRATAGTTSVRAESLRGSISRAASWALPTKALRARGSDRTVRAVRPASRPSRVRGELVVTASWPLLSEHDPFRVADEVRADAWPRRGRVALLFEWQEEVLEEVVYLALSGVLTEEMHRPMADVLLDVGGGGRAGSGGIDVGE